MCKKLLVLTKSCRSRTGLNQLGAAANFDDLVKFGDCRQIRRFPNVYKTCIWIRMWCHFQVSSNHTVARQLTAVNVDFRHEVLIFHKPNCSSLIDNYFRHKTPCGIRKLMAAFVSKIGVFSRFSWSLDFGAKMAEFPFPFLQIWRSRKRVAIHIQLMNIHVSECKYYCLHLVPKFGDVRDHRSITSKLVTPTAPSCIDNSWRSTTLPAADSTVSNQTLPFQNEHEWVLEKLR